MDYHFNYSKCFKRPAIHWIILIAIAMVCISTPIAPGRESAKVFRAGAYAIDITPLELPVIWSDAHQ